MKNRGAWKRSARITVFCLTVLFFGSIECAAFVEDTREAPLGEYAWAAKATPPEEEAWAAKATPPEAAAPPEEEALPEEETPPEEKALPEEEAPPEKATSSEAERAMGEKALLETGGEVTEISDGDQLIQWLQEHCRSGGKAVLTEDVTVDSPYLYSYVRGGKPVELDTDSYTLTIEEFVSLEGFSNLIIHGTGGSGNSIIRVAPEGSLFLAYNTIYVDEEAEGIYTIWQEDGSTLSIDQSEFTKVDDPIHYSGIMTGILYQDAVTGYEALPEDGKIEDGALPETALILLYANDKEGNQIKYHAPIVWDLEQAREERKDHIRVGVQGTVDMSEYPGVVIEDILEYWLCFQTKDAVFLDVTKNISPNPLYNRVQIAAHLSVTRNFDQAFFMWSTDGETWEKEKVEYHEMFEGKLMVDCSLTDDKDYYICVEFMDGDSKYYSNVLLTREDALIEAEDFEGGRGGGTDITGNELPPIDGKPPQEDDEGGNQEKPDSDGSVIPPPENNGGTGNGSETGPVIPPPENNGGTGNGSETGPVIPPPENNGGTGNGSETGPVIPPPENSGGGGNGSETGPAETPPENSGGTGNGSETGPIQTPPGNSGGPGTGPIQTSPENSGGPGIGPETGSAGMPPGNNAEAENGSAGPPLENNGEAETGPAGTPLENSGGTGTGPAEMPPKNSGETGNGNETAMPLSENSGGSGLGAAADASSSDTGVDRNDSYFSVTEQGKKEEEPGTHGGEAGQTPEYAEAHAPDQGSVRDLPAVQVTAGVFATILIGGGAAYVSAASTAGGIPLVKALRKLFNLIRFSK